MKDNTEERIRGAVARGWGHPKNAHKDMDTDLAVACSDEVLKELKAIDKEKETRHLSKKVKVHLLVKRTAGRIWYYFTGMCGHEIGFKMAPENEYMTRVLKDVKCKKCLRKWNSLSKVEQERL